MRIERTIRRLFVQLCLLEVPVVEQDVIMYKMLKTNLYPVFCSPTQLYFQKSTVMANILRMCISDKNYATVY